MTKPDTLADLMLYLAEKKIRFSISWGPSAGMWEVLIGNYVDLNCESLPDALRFISDRLENDIPH